jgi:hypothetical protein
MGIYIGGAACPQPMYVLKIKLVSYTQSGTAIAIRVAALLPPGFSTLRTTLGLLGKAFRCEEFLFPNSESEASSTIGTMDGFL